MKLKILLLGIVLLHFACSEENPALTDESGDAGSPELQPLHEKFDFTADDFEPRVLGDNPLFDSLITGDPENFLEIVFRIISSETGQLRLVDKGHALEPDYCPAELVDLSAIPDLHTSREDLKLERRAAKELTELSKAAAADGVTLLISSSYRSYDYQESLFRRFAERDGEEMASRYSARAGTSQHQLGTTVDLGDITNNFASSDAGIWMEKNAGAFGWSLSYPLGMEELTGYKWESWHWRWIGVDAVFLQDEYFNGSQQLMLEYWNKNAPVFIGALIQ